MANGIRNRKSETDTNSNKNPIAASASASASAFLALGVDLEQAAGRTPHEHRPNTNEAGHCALSYYVSPNLVLLVFLA
jgi:hypothetical protein